MKNSIILCVDDDKSVLDSLKFEIKRGMGDDHQIEIAQSGLEALNILDDLLSRDYRVPVIIADYIMPGMKGDELLQRAHEKSSRTYKIMLTGQADAKGIANSVNKAELYKVIFKPWDNIDLIFTLNEAIRGFLKNELIEKQYLELKKNKELTKTLKEYNFKITRSIEEKKRVFNLVLPSIMELTTVFERGFFKSHTKFIIKLSLKIAEELQMDSESKTSIVIICLLYHKIMQNMPEQFQGIDPNTLAKPGIKSYFECYNEQIDIISQDEYLNKYVLLLFQLWEHYDGTGLPHSFTFNRLTKITQIINLSINYHIGVYKYNDEQKEKLEKTGEILQTPEQTAQRHATTLQYIFKNSSWYDLDIIDGFQRLVKANVIKDQLVERGLIKIYMKGDDISVATYSLNEFHYDKDQKIIIPVEKFLEDYRKKEQESLAKSKRSLTTVMNLTDLRAGMITGQDVITKFGRLIVPRDTMLTPEDIDEINKIKKHGLLYDKNDVRVYIPREA
jgi:FixJ family two-component response regulator